MEYQIRLANRRREFEGKVLPPLTQTESSAETTIPAPMGWEYVRGYYPTPKGCFVNTPLPFERIGNTFLKRFEY